MHWRKYKKLKIMRFNPDREFIEQAVAEFKKAGGKVTHFENSLESSNSRTFRDDDSSIFLLGGKNDF